MKPETLELLTEMFDNAFDSTTEHDEIIKLLTSAEDLGMTATVERIKTDWLTSDGRKWVDVLPKLDNGRFDFGDGEEDADRSPIPTVHIIEGWNPVDELSECFNIIKDEATVRAQDREYISKLENLNYPASAAIEDLKLKQQREFDNLHGWNKSMLERRQA